MSAPRVGILALQGDFAAHASALHRIGAQPVEVRLPGDLTGCSGLLIPGGESTTLLKLLEPHGLLEAIPAFHRQGGALFGTCAGAILLARGVVPSQVSFGLIEMDVERNAYGRQRQSFEADASTTERFRSLLPAGTSGPDDRLPMLFIRAPRITAVGGDVEVLATWSDEPVLIRQGNVLACTGHPELTTELRVHRVFVDVLCAAGSNGPSAWERNLTGGARFPDHESTTPGPENSMGVAPPQGVPASPQSCGNEGIPGMEAK